MEPGIYLILRFSLKKTFSHTSINNYTYIHINVDKDFSFKILCDLASLNQQSAIPQQLFMRNDENSVMFCNRFYGISIFADFMQFKTSQRHHDISALSFFCFVFTFLHVNGYIGVL